jgi:hypothetical protein
VFIGHVAVGFALKRVAPRTSLDVLIAAPQFLVMTIVCGCTRALRARARDRGARPLVVPAVGGVLRSAPEPNTAGLKACTTPVAGHDKRS